MLRSVKYGLCGGVLVAIVAGTVAWTEADKTVTLVVDGQSHSVHTTASNVSGALRAAGYQLGSHDLLAPAAGSGIHNGSTVVVERGRLLHLQVDGAGRDVWTTAPTVADAVAELGYSQGSYVSVSRSQRLPLSPTDLVVRTPHTVLVVHDGKRETAQTTAATVGALLSDIHLALDRGDRIKPALTSELYDARQIVITRVHTGNIVIARAVPFATKRTSDPTLLAGQTETIASGREGLAKITYQVVYVNGRASQKTLINTAIVRAAVPSVVKVGIKPLPAPAAAVPGTTPSQGQAIAIGRQLVAARGWGTDQFNCLFQLWGHESGWRVNAGNASGAYGIPQALPGSKMGSAGPGWQNNATTQITWGLNYIQGRYGTPCGAWSTWQSQGWY